MTQQIQLLEVEKISRTTTQQKIDSNLLYTARMLAGHEAAPGIAYLNTGIDLDQKNNLVVDIKARVSEALLLQLRGMGAQVLFFSERYGSIRALLPASQLESAAALPDVIFIGRKQGYILEGAGGDQRRAAGFGQRAARVKSQLSGLLQSGQTSGTGQGSVTTEGDLTHRAFDARGAFGINGAWLKIGVLSDSADALGSATAAQGTGDLPPTCPGSGGPCLTILQDFGGGSDEGTAMMEIIYDMAPGASLYFATADVSEAGFAQNIQNLRNAGCDIIVDDVFYFDEPVFQDGVVAQAVSAVAASGALYFSSAGNEGNVDSATAGYFEGDFNDAGSPAFTFPGGAKSGTIHNFGSAGAPVNGDIILAAGFDYTLNWADPSGASSNDYDLFLVDQSGQVLASSTNIQSGSQDPFEEIAPPFPNPGDRLVVFKTAAAKNVFFAINTIRGLLTVATPGQTHGHSAASATGIFSVAATPAAAAFGPGSPSGPFPNPFNSSDQVEVFTSDGPRRVFFNPDGTPITPGNFSSSGGAVRSKPDITGADGVSTTLPPGSGLNPFYGTSAAAPSAASVAALVKSAKPGLTQSDIRNALVNTAIDIMAPGADRDSGAGIVMAFEAVSSLGVPGFANPELDTVTASENPGNGDGVLEAGEGGRLVIGLKNTSGVQSATAITTILTTTTQGVTVTQPNSSAYADILAGATGGNNLSPFTFTLASNFPCAQSVDFMLTVTYTGGPVRVLTFSVPTGMVTLSASLGSKPPTIPGLTTATGTQLDRIFRDGNPSACGSVKPFPGTLGTNSRTYDSYTFTACQSSCISPTVSSANGSSLFESAYSPSFDPNNIGTNYIGDAGSSGNMQSVSIDLTAGNSYTFVVNDVPGTSAGTSYTMQIPVCAFNCNFNQVPVAKVRSVTVTAATIGGSANANIDNGSFDPDGDPITITQSPAGPYPNGVTSVMLTVVDSKGATAQATAMVTVLDPTTIVLSSSSNPAAFPAPITLTATLTPAIATGPVTFMDGAATLGVGILSGGVANFTTNALAIGSHTITAVYGGNGSIGSGISPPLTQTMTGSTALTADVGVSIALVPNNPVIAIGGQLAVNVTVTNFDANNAAQVALNLNSIGPAELDSLTPASGASCVQGQGQSVQCTIPTLAPGTNEVFSVVLRPLFSDARTLTVLAAEASDTTDSNSANNSASQTIPVRFKPFRQ